MEKSISKILDKYPSPTRDHLIPLLQDVQDAGGYISQEDITEIGKFIGIPASKIYGVATFYNQFRFHPVGKYHIQICRGTACHVLGSATVQDTIQDILGLKPGMTTRDGIFSLEVVACIGACGLAPVISVNGRFHGNVSKDSVEKIIQEYRSQESKNEKGEIVSNG